MSTRLLHRQPATLAGSSSRTCLESDHPSLPPLLPAAQVSPQPPPPVYPAVPQVIPINQVMSSFAQNPQQLPSSPGVTAAFLRRARGLAFPGQSSSPQSHQALPPSLTVSGMPLSRCSLHTGPRGQPPRCLPVPFQTAACAPCSTASSSASPFPAPVVTGGESWVTPSVSPGRAATSTG